MHTERKKEIIATVIMSTRTHIFPPFLLSSKSMSIIHLRTHLTVLHGSPPQALIKLYSLESSHTRFVLRRVFAQPEENVIDEVVAVVCVFVWRKGQIVRV